MTIHNFDLNLKAREDSSTPGSLMPVYVFQHYYRPLTTCWCLGPNSALQNITVRSTWTINHNLSIDLTNAEQQESPLQYDTHVCGDLGLYFHNLRVGARVFHITDGLLEGGFTWWNDHSRFIRLLGQSVEDMHHWFNWSLWLQRLSLDAGIGWSALFPPLIGLLCFLPLTVNSQSYWNYLFPFRLSAKVCMFCNN